MVETPSFIYHDNKLTRMIRMTSVLERLEQKGHKCPEAGALRIALGAFSKIAMPNGLEIHVKALEGRNIDAGHLTINYAAGLKRLEKVHGGLPKKVKKSVSSILSRLKTANKGGTIPIPDLIKYFDTVNQHKDMAGKLIKMDEIFDSLLRAVRMVAGQIKDSSAVFGR